jgi:hypothetical protein
MSKQENRPDLATTLRSPRTIWQNLTGARGDLAPTLANNPARGCFPLTKKDAREFVAITARQNGANAEATLEQLITMRDSIPVEYAVSRDIIAKAIAKLARKRR